VPINRRDGHRRTCARSICAALEVEGPVPDHGTAKSTAGFEIGFRDCRAEPARE
jgi:hypothetical protein